MYLAAHGPKMLAGPARVADGVLTYMQTPQACTDVRAAVGPDATINLMMPCCLTTDAEIGRRMGRNALRIYLSLPAYQRLWRRDGFTPTDWADGGSDALVDTYMNWGDPTRSRRACASASTTGSRTSSSVRHPADAVIPIRCGRCSKHWHQGDPELLSDCGDGVRRPYGALHDTDRDDRRGPRTAGADEALHRRRGDQGRARARAGRRGRPPPRHRPADGALPRGRGARPGHVARRARSRRFGHPAQRRPDRRPPGRGEGARPVGARTPGRDRRRRAAVHGLRVRQRDHRALGVRLRSPSGTATMQDSIMLHLYASDEQRERYLAPLVAGGRFPSVGLTEPEVAGSDPTQMQTTAVPRRRRVGDQRPQVVHLRRVTRRVHDGVRQDRTRRREAHAVQLDHRADRHARLPDPAGRADDGPRRRPALRGRATTTCACR